MNERAIEQAAQWHMALQHSDADWDGFTVWLEADPAHRKAYDAIAIVDDLVERNRDALAAAQSRPVVPPAVSRVRWKLAAVAAVGVLALVLSWSRLPFVGAESHSYTAQAGKVQQIGLPDGTRITLAAASSLTVAGRDQRHLTLQGSAYFDVPHDPARRMIIESGNFQVRDIGTRFEIATAPAGIRVSVAEGELTVTARNLAQSLPVTAGQQLVVSGIPTTAEYVAVAAQDIASWRSGRLVFHNAPLSQVVAEISRYGGVEVAADPQVADRRFSGVLTIGDGTALVGRLEEIMGLAAQQRDGSLHLVPAGDQ
ncbi:MAG: FecR domain-containing protein [Pseudomonadota bacterium]